MAVSGGKAAGETQPRCCSTRAAVVVLIVLSLALAVINVAAVVRMATLQESLRTLTTHKDRHRSKAEMCKQGLQEVKALLSVDIDPERDAAAVPQEVKALLSVDIDPERDAAAVPSRPASTSEAIFSRSFPQADTPIASCDAFPVDCTDNMCVDTSQTSVFEAGTAAQTCTNVCAAFSDCNYFWLYDSGRCCLKSSYDTAKALAPGGMRTGVAGDFYRLTQRGPAPPPYVRPPTGAGTRTGGKYQCSQSSWAGKNPTSTQTTRVRTVRFKEKDSLPSDTLPSMLRAIQATNHDGEERRYVDFGSGQHCFTKDNDSLYDIGVLTHFSHALVKMDEIVDCSGKQHPCVCSFQVQ